MGPIVDALMIKYRPTAVVSRSVARDLGLKHFFTGSGCRRGHEAVRFVSDGSCAVCASVRGRASDAANPERRRARERARYELDPTKFCERASAYRASDPVRQKELRQKRKEDDPEYFRRWYAENAEDQRAKAPRAPCS